MGNIKNLWPIIDGAAKEAGRDASQLTKDVELFFSYSQNYDEALASARKWKSALIPNILNLPIHDSRELERQGNQISDDELAKVWTITTGAEPIIKKAEEASQAPYSPQPLSPCRSVIFHWLSPSHTSTTSCATQRWGLQQFSQTS